VYLFQDTINPYKYLPENPVGIPGFSVTNSFIKVDIYFFFLFFLFIIFIIVYIIQI
jgi:hypothetical protein